MGALVSVEHGNAVTTRRYSTLVKSTVTDLTADLVDRQLSVAASSSRGEVTPGREVVFGAPPMDPVWHTPPGIALLGPRHFGFDFDHVPLELTGRRP